MNKPSSTAQAAGVAPFVAATILLLLKIFTPEVYAQIPADYQGHLIAMVAFVFAWRQRENTYTMVDPSKYSIIPKEQEHGP